MDKKIISKVMSEMGRRGAKKQSAAMTPEQRKERARLAARARWAKRNREGS